MKRVNKPETIKVDKIVVFEAEPKTFMQKADETVKSLLLDTGNDVHKALDRLKLYMNEAGEKVRNKKELRKAKEKLEKMIKH